ncbi:MAG: glycosyltransferase family 4 protein [Phycisphaerales bacterium]
MPAIRPTLESTDARGRHRRVRPLIIAEAANPEWTSVPLVGWHHSRALCDACDGHVVTQVRNRGAFERAGFPAERVTFIDSEAVEARVFRLAERLRGGRDRGWTTVTALGAMSYPYFEYLVWKRFGARLRAGEFDLVHRLTPLSPAVPSFIAYACARARVPFVLGPINGGVPWPEGFEAARRGEKERLASLRWVQRCMPGYSGTRLHASAIMIASRAALADMPRRFRGRCVYVPENAVEPEVFGADPDRQPSPPLRIAFIGRLVSGKAVDILLDAAAPLIREGRVTIDIIGDGPEMGPLRAMVEREGIAGGVEFAGWVDHSKLRDRAGRSHVFGFPSVREFGGGAVVEAMSMGLVPVVLDYGGPGELVTPSTGFAIPMGSRSDIVARMRAVLSELVVDPSLVRAMSERARERVLRWFTWRAKASQVAEVYSWVLGRRAAQPDWGMPFPDDGNARSSVSGASSPERG